MIVFLVFTLLFSIIIVGAQILWKAGINDVMVAGFNISDIPSLIVSRKVLTGSVLYIFAIFLYFYLQSNYEFSKVQLVTIPVALVFSVFAGMMIFNDKISIPEMVGISLIFAGVIIVAMNISS